MIPEDWLFDLVVPPELTATRKELLVLDPSWIIAILEQAERVEQSISASRFNRS